MVLQKLLSALGTKPPDRVVVVARAGTRGKVRRHERHDLNVGTRSGKAIKFALRFLDSNETGGARQRLRQVDQEDRRTGIVLLFSALTRNSK
jgi:hypothetical protein